METSSSFLSLKFVILVFLLFPRCQLSGCYKHNSCKSRRKWADHHYYRHQQGARDHLYKQPRKPTNHLSDVTCCSSRDHLYKQSGKPTTHPCDITHHCSRDNPCKQPRKSITYPCNITCLSSRDHLRKQPRKPTTCPHNITPPVSAGQLFNQLQNLISHPCCNLQRGPAEDKPSS